MLLYSYGTRLPRLPTAGPALGPAAAVPATCPSCLCVHPASRAALLGASYYTVGPAAFGGWAVGTMAAAAGINLVCLPFLEGEGAVSTIRVHTTYDGAGEDEEEEQELDRFMVYEPEAAHQPRTPCVIAGRCVTSNHDVARAQGAGERVILLAKIERSMAERGILRTLGIRAQREGASALLLHSMQSSAICPPSCGPARTGAQALPHDVGGGTTATPCRESMHSYYSAAHVLEGQAQEQKREEPQLWRHYATPLRIPVLLVSSVGCARTHRLVTETLAEGRSRLVIRLAPEPWARSAFWAGGSPACATAAVAAQHLDKLLGAAAAAAPMPMGQLLLHVAVTHGAGLELVRRLLVAHPTAATTYLRVTSIPTGVLT
jgi:hypothetical protein